MRTLAWKQDSIVHQIIKTCISNSLDGIQEENGENVSSNFPQKENSFLLSNKGGVKMGRAKMKGAKLQ